MEKDIPDIPTIFGQNVQKYRKALGLTQDQLSERLDITQKHLSFIETGTQFASAGLIGKIANELQIPPAWLFGDDLNQLYMDKLYVRIATFFTNEMNNIKSQIINEIKKQS